MPSPRGIGTEGHITQAPLRAKEQKESQLGITFDRAVLKTETDLPLVAQIQAIVAPPSARTNENTGQPAYPGTTSGALPVAAPEACSRATHRTAPARNLPQPETRTVRWATRTCSCRPRRTERRAHSSAHRRTP